MLGYIEILLAISFFLFLCHWRLNRNSFVTNWPFIGMLPELLCNLSNLHDHAAQVLNLAGGTSEFKGPWFTKMNFVLTCDPMNVHHILSQNFGNYNKGPDFREVLDVFGDGILAADADEWKRSRESMHSYMRQKNFELSLEKSIQNKVRNCLLPLLDQVQERGMQVNLQDVFRRFTFDTICSIVMGFDPKCLAIDFPRFVYSRAFDQVSQTMFYRHIVPKCFWKLQKWLQIGPEKRMTEARKTLDHFLHECVTSTRNELNRRNERKKAEKPQSMDSSSVPEKPHFDLFATSIMEQEKKGQVIDDKFLRDTAFNLLAAGRDTVTSGLTWFFWLVATHPSVEAKILQEIKENFAAEEGNKDQMIISIRESKKLVYLHGAICEALRLYPPIPYNHKNAIKSDILPSGHQISPNTMVMYSPYAMGRSEAVWGADYLEFKPERWISSNGGIIHVPSYKFITFSAGPRTCLGKNLSLTEMKMVASAILWNYRIKVAEGHPISANLSIVLLMRYGLKVKVEKRDRSHSNRYLT